MSATRALAGVADTERGALGRPDDDMYNNLFGSPTVVPVTTPNVADASISAQICAGVASGELCNMRATTPATCGVAIEVPLITCDALSLV